LIFQTLSLVTQFGFVQNDLALLVLAVARRYLYTVKKKVIDFPVPSRDVTYQTLPGQE
jgi:hypothetical protein